MNLKIKKLHKEAKIPQYAYAHDAAFDLISVEDVKIAPNQRVQVSIGIAIQIPEGHVGLIWDKSGLSHKHGLKTLGGVIDAGYRGEIKVSLINLGQDSYQVEKGHKVAQMIIQKKETYDIIEVEELEESDRGEAGFGSSGK